MVKQVVGAVLFILLAGFGGGLAVRMVQFEFGGQPLEFTFLLGQAMIVLALMIMVYYRSGWGSPRRRAG